MASGRRMRLAALAAVGLGWLAAVEAADTARIDAQALLERIENRDADLLVLDVRTAQEYAEGHVPGAVNIHYTHLPARISELPWAASRDIVLYCTVGVRAERAANRLREHGYLRLLHLDGDMRGWRKRGLPIEK
ncbi:MAG TPA: rhodanese-like domain-containing protein [Burkholderiales bacterium]|nr:rhodanese-like domain-containing protein [Burkholderiales bacterium]